MPSAKDCICPPPSKVCNGQCGPFKACPSGIPKKREVELLQCKGYADAVLLHRPPRGENGLPSNVEAWKLLEAVKDKGLAR